MIAVAGNGNIVSVEKQVSSFIRLHLSVNGFVELIQSDEEKVMIEADDNLQDYFEVVNSGRTLYITNEAKLRRPIFSDLTIKVFFRQMDTLYNACHGDVVTVGEIYLNNPLDIKIMSHGNTELAISTPSIKLTTACHGNISLRGQCNDLTIKHVSHGNMDCKEMLANHASLHNVAHGDVKLYSKESIIIKNYGNSHIHYFGPGQLKDVVQNGNGEIKYKG